MSLRPATSSTTHDRVKPSGAMFAFAIVSVAPEPSRTATACAKEAVPKASASTDEKDSMPVECMPV
jgi:hypothetical protein